MPTDNTSQQAKDYLIQQLASIANSSAGGIDGTTRIKAAVMAAYLSGLPVPSGSDAKGALVRLEVEFGIDLLTPART